MTSMPLAQTLKRRWKWLLLIVPVTIVALVVGGTYIYIHFIAPDPAPRLAFTSVDSSASSGSGAAGTGDASATAPGAIDGTWSVTDGSKVQYRVQEVLSGQDNEATGTATAVTGTFTVSGTTVSTGSFTVDMTKFSSGEGLRDSQFRNRIMETSKFPTATFELTEPIALGSIPDNLVEITVQAKGDFTLHGVTKALTIDMKARRNGGQLEVNGTVPVTFSDYEIDDPSGGPASVGDDGEMEFLLIFRES